MRRLAALLILAPLLLGGCSKRAHLNPFDPANPQTGGRPAGFVALAGNQTVILRWDPTSSPGLLGYQIFRRGPDDADFRPLTGVLPSVTSSIGDFGLANGREHRYRIYFVFQGGLGSLPAEDVATPGPLRPWIADVDAGALVRTTADGRHLAESLTFTGVAPAAIAVDAATGTVWTCGPGGDVLAYAPPAAGGSMVIPGFPQPVSVLVDRVGRTVWIGDATTQQVLHLQVTGAPATPAVVTGIQNPASMALDAQSRSLWIVDRDGNRVLRYSASGGLLSSTDMAAPSRIALDQVTHEAWVTSFDMARVVRLSPFGVPLDTISALAGPVGIAVDGARQRVWVADAYGDRVLALRRDGSVEFTLTGETHAQEIAVDDSTGEAWVTLYSIGAVARLSPDGHEILRVGGMSGPWGIALDDVRLRESPLPGATAALPARRTPRPAR